MGSITNKVLLPALIVLGTIPGCLFMSQSNKIALSRVNVAADTQIARSRVNVVVADTLAFSNKGVYLVKIGKKYFIQDFNELLKVNRPKKVGEDIYFVAETKKSPAYWFDRGNFHKEHSGR